MKATERQLEEFVKMLGFRVQLESRIPMIGTLNEVIVSLGNDVVFRVSNSSSFTMYQDDLITRAPVTDYSDIPDNERLSFLLGCLTERDISDYQKAFKLLGTNMRGKYTRELIGRLVKLRIRPTMTTVDITYIVQWYNSTLLAYYPDFTLDLE